MIQLAWTGAPGREGGVALLFGSGLIGGTVPAALGRLVADLQMRALHWTWPEPAPAEVAAIETAARDALAARPGARLTVIWAAGRSGFGTDDAGMAQEARALRGVIAFTLRLFERLMPARRGFVHVSSAGGLFEGQIACDAASTPAPLRPYGAGKLEQEALVRAEPGLGARSIIRPSSVYGYTPGGRQGLVPALVSAALGGREAAIFGALTTQRDYVFAADIGRYIAERLCDDIAPDGVETALLAAGRPATVFEILRLIEDRMGQPLRLRIDPRPQNARDNTFLPSVLPAGFAPTRLAEGIALTATALGAERWRGTAR